MRARASRSSATAACAARSVLRGLRDARCRPRPSASAAAWRSLLGLRRARSCSFWRCCSTMRGQLGELGELGRRPRRCAPSSVAICWSAPARACSSARCSAPIAAWRSVRARCSRSSVMSSVRLSRDARCAGALAAVCGGRELGFQRLRAAQRSQRRLGLGQLLVRLDQRPRRLRALASETPRCGSRSRAPAAPSRSARRASAPAWPASRARAGAGGAPRPGRRDAARLAPRRRRAALVGGCGAPRPPAPSSSPSRLRSASRLAAAVGASAAATKPSQRHRSPSRETSRWPGFSVRCRRGPSLRRDDADLAQAARQLGRAGDVGDRAARRRSGRAGSSSAAAFDARQCTRRLGGGRRVEIVAECGAERHLVARRDLDLVERSAAGRCRRAGISSLASVSTSVLSWPAARPAWRAASRLALASRGGLRTASSAASVSRLDLGDLGHQLLADLGRGLELGGVRRAADDLARLRVERRQLPLELGDLLAAARRCCASRLWRRARASAARRGELGEARLGAPCSAASASSSAASAFCSKSAARRVVLGERSLSRRRGARASPWPRRSATASRAMSRSSCSTRASSSRWRSAARCASRSRLSCSILKRARMAPLARLLLAQRLDAVGGLRLGPQRLGLGLAWRAPSLLQRRGERCLLGIDLRLRLDPAQMQQRRPRPCGSRPTAPCSAAPAAPGASGSRSAS